MPPADIAGQVSIPVLKPPRPPETVSPPCSEAFPWCLLCFPDGGQSSFTAAFPMPAQPHGRRGHSANGSLLRTYCVPGSVLSGSSEPVNSLVGGVYILVRRQRVSKGTDRETSASHKGYEKNTGEGGRGRQV